VNHSSTIRTDTPGPPYAIGADRSMGSWQRQQQEKTGNQHWFHVKVLRSLMAKRELH
jgi:hypothetical protein